MTMTETERKLFCCSGKMVFYAVLNIPMSIACDCFDSSIVSMIERKKNFRSKKKKKNESVGS